MLFFRKNNLYFFLIFSFIANISIAFAKLDVSIKQIKLEKSQDKVVINLEQSSVLSPKIIELLERGIPIAFNLKIKLIKENKFWFDQVIKQDSFIYQIKYHSLIKIFEVIDIHGNKNNFKEKKEAIKFLLDNKEITIDNYNILKNTILKIWVELDKNRLPKAIQVDVFNKSWDIQSNIIFYDMSRL